MNVPPTAGGPVVVIADDDADIRTLVAVAAGKAGAAIGATAIDGTQALQAIRDIRPALAILDVSMPGLTGLQVCASVRADPGLAHTKIILLSAAVHPAAVEAGMEVGTDRYTQKPFSPRSLAAEIRELLDMAALGR